LLSLLQRYGLLPWWGRDRRSGAVVRLTPASAFDLFAGSDGVDFYQVLGISSRASPSEVKAAFRQLAKALHPDRNAGNRAAERHFAVVHYAYTILGNAEWRAAYDQELERFRANAQLQLAEAISRGLETRRRRFWREAAQMTAGTMVLTVCFVAGASLWQQMSNRLQRNQTMAPSSASLNAPTVSREELAEALFGSEVTVQSGTLPATAEQLPPQSTASAGTARAGEPAVAENDAVADLPSRERDQVARTLGYQLVGLGERYLAEADLYGSKATAQRGASPATAGQPPPQPMAPAEFTNVGKPTSLGNNDPADRSSRDIDHIARTQGARLVERGKRYLAEGNIAIARQYFARAADLGFAVAAIQLAETFEPDSLARHRVHGVRPDPTEASKWRNRALELGSKTVMRLAEPVGE